ncbi:MAG: hypothetical protein ACREFF_06720 [Candidatus Udaeobacter sp.]
MKHTTGKTLDLAVIVVALTFVSNTRPGEIGHFNGGVMNIREYVMPDPGFYTAIYNYFYMTDQVNNSNGEAINSVIIKPGPGPFPAGGIPKVSAPTGK